MSEPKEHEIFTAIHAFDLAKVREILATSPAAANECSSVGFTPLMILASTTLHEMSYYKKLAALSKLGLVASDASAQVVNNKSLLVIENMAKALVATPGIELNAVTESNGQTALHIAADSNNEDLVNLLIEAKADLNAQDTFSGMTPLMLAASYAVRRALYYAGADPKVQDKHGNNVLHHILSKTVPDIPSSSLIATPELLNVKNDIGFTPQELAEATVKSVNATAEAQRKADALRPKREWEQCFENEISATSEFASAPAPAPILIPKKKWTCWRRFLTAFSVYFCCCAKRTSSQAKVLPPSPPLPVSNNTTPPGEKKALQLTANDLIFGTKVTAPKDVLLRSDAVKGEFVPHAGPCLGSYEDICCEEDEKDFYKPNDTSTCPPNGESEARRDAPSMVSPNGEPEAVAAGAQPQPEGDRQPETPLHRQSNFTSEQEPPGQTQVEKDMDEVFALLRGQPIEPAQS